MFFCCGLQILADSVHDEQIEKNVIELQIELKAMLEEMRLQLPNLKVEYEENKELKALREQSGQMSSELTKWRERCAEQEDLIRLLQAQLAASQQDVLDIKEKDRLIIDGKDAEIAELKSQLQNLKATNTTTVSDLEAEILALKQKLVSAEERGNQEESAKNSWKAEKEKLDGMLTQKDTEIDELKAKLTAMQKELNDTKDALDKDESELKKDRELLLKDQQEIIANQTVIEDLKKRLQALEKELKESKEKVRTAVLLYVLSSGRKSFSPHMVGCAGNTGY